MKNSFAIFKVDENYLLKFLRDGFPSELQARYHIRNELNIPGNKYVILPVYTC